MVNEEMPEMNLSRHSSDDGMLVGNAELKEEAVVNEDVAASRPGSENMAEQVPEGESAEPAVLGDNLAAEYPEEHRESSEFEVESKPEEIYSEEKSGFEIVDEEGIVGNEQESSPTEEHHRIPSENVEPCKEEVAVMDDEKEVDTAETVSPDVDSVQLANDAELQMLDKAQELPKDEESSIKTPEELTLDSEEARHLHEEQQDHIRDPEPGMSVETEGPESTEVPEEQSEDALLAMPRENVADPEHAVLGEPEECYPVMMPTDQTAGVGYAIDVPAEEPKEQVSDPEHAVSREMPVEPEESACETSEKDESGMTGPDVTAAAPVLPPDVVAGTLQGHDNLDVIGNTDSAVVTPDDDSEDVVATVKVDTAVAFSGTSDSAVVSPDEDFLKVEETGTEQKPDDVVPGDEDGRDFGKASPRPEEIGDERTLAEDAGDLFNIVDLNQQSAAATNPFVGISEASDFRQFDSVDDVQGQNHADVVTFHGDSAEDRDSLEREPLPEFDPQKEWGQPLGLPAPNKPAADKKKTATSPTKPPARQTQSALAKSHDDSSVSNSRKTASKSASARPQLSKKAGPGVGKAPSATKPLGNPFYVDLAYIPGHGSADSVDADFFRRVRARYYVLSTAAPDPAVLGALMDGKSGWDDGSAAVTIIPTYDAEVLRYWMAAHHDQLSQLNIDVAPAANRCTIQLQDHDTGCAAFRLEF
jgi:hypothetical protein